MSPTGQGDFLDKAITITEKLNQLLPGLLGLGAGVAALILKAKADGRITPEQEDRARQALAAFEKVSTEVRQTAEQWLAEHPPED